MDRRDLTSGAMGAALSSFGRRMDEFPGSSAVVYICGYTASINERPFMLPISANIRRPTDVMTQGILAKAAVDLLIQGEPSRAILALDLTPVPESDAAPLDSLVETEAPSGLGMIAAAGRLPDEGPTSLSVALTSMLSNPRIETGALIADVRKRLESQQSILVTAALAPRESLPLAIEEAPPEPNPIEQPEPPTEALVPPQAPRSLPTLPDDPEMTHDQRRLVQEALKHVGYYAGPIDGVFGPETRAGIRRFQFEIGAEMTGSITGKQAVELVTSTSVAH
jgi:hypothetical protein